MMSRRRKLVMVTATAGALLGSLAGVEPQATAAPDKFTAAVAREHNIPADRLKTGDTLTQEFEYSGTKLDVAKLVDSKTGKTYQVAFDQSGKPADLDKAAAKDAEARLAKHGKLDPSLADKLTKVGAADPIPVSIWVKTADSAPPRALATSPDRAEQERADQLGAVKGAVQGKRRSVIDQLARLGASAIEPEYAPAVFATLNSEQIQKLARSADVDTIYAATNDNTVFQDDAATTERAYPIWQTGNLGAGVGSRPVVHENDGVSDGNPYLNNAAHPVVFWCASVTATCPNGKMNVGSTQTHASEVAGAIASTHPLDRGIAPSAQMILSANSQNLNDDAKNVAAYEWARGNGGDPVNMSWGQICPDGNQNFISRYIDWAVKNLGSTFTISSGNTNGCASNDLMVSAPGVAWTAITVGSQFDGNNGFWNGDGMSGFSRYINPTFAPGMEKPEVVAVGQDVRLTDNAGGDHLTPAGINGTSFSAPQVAGQVTSMLARQPGQNGWPETNKANVLASAWHDVVAGTSQDGVGSVVMNSSDETYRYSRYRNDVGNTPADFPRNYAVALTAGQVVRTAIAWDAWSTGGGGSDQLGADIDLSILKPDGTYLASSTSVQNAWEVVQFTVPVTGTYTFRANLFSSVAGWPGTYLGMAYSIRNLPTICTGMNVLPATGGTFAINTANGPTFFDSYAGWALNQSGREQVARIILPATKDLTFTDNNPTLDLHVLQFAACDGNVITPTVVGNGADSVFVDNAPAGIYYLVVDGPSVGTGTATVTVSGP